MADGEGDDGQGPATEAMDAAEAVVEAGAPAGPPGVLRERYTVRSGSPIPGLSMPNAEAYPAEDKRDPNRKLYALICPPGVPPRVNVMRAIKGVSSPGMQQLVEWGPMMWAPAGRQCMTVIYERPAGGRVIGSLRGDIRRIEDYDIGPKLIEPVCASIKELITRGITHRAIRPTNLYYMDEGGERIVLGDCVTSPPAMDQPLLFETIESGMANPMARGGGTHADDLYSLGVTLAILLMGRNLAGHLDDAALMRAKIQQGTYATLVGDTRLPLAMIELLRGLLCDDSKLRWDVESLDLWMQGRRLSPLQSRAGKRAARGFPFQGREYYYGRELAAAMARNWDAAVPPVLEGKLELWLRRAVEDKERAQAVSDVVRLSLGGGDKKMASDLVLCKVLMLLDPAAPIRFKGFNAFPDGVGTALAMLVAKRADTKPVVDCILKEIPKMWFEAQGEYQPDNSLMEQNFKELRGYLTQTGMGYGLERCLYEMNDALPCQSPLLGERYVVELKELLPALNAVAPANTDGKKWPCDRHVAAFMGARARSDIDRNLTALSDADAGKGLMALINLFAVFQYRLGPESLPALAAWIGSLAGVAVTEYHSREKRKELEKELPKLVRKGSLVEIYNLLEDTGAREKDRTGFEWAKAQYAAADEEIKRVQADDDERDKEADRAGRQMAAVTGILISMITVTIIVIMKVW